MERPGVVVGADELLEKVWGFFPRTGSRDLVRAHMRNLRAKISRTTAGREVVRTLPRRGYRFVTQGGPQFSLDFVWSHSYPLIERE